MASAANIQSLAHMIRANAPHLGMGASLSPSMRLQLRDLAEAADMPRAVAAKANDSDLISVYLVALKDGDAAKRTAAKIALRLDDTLFGTPAPVEPAAPPSAPASVDMAAIRAMIRDAVKEGALAPLQSALDEFDEQTNERFGKLASALDNLRGELADGMGQLAHDAAVEALKALSPTVLQIVRADPPTTLHLGLVHRETAKIINALSAGVNVYLHGPAGSGKTTVARKCAEAFGLQFYFAAKVESEYQLIGFKDAKGDTVRTQFREAYEHGGVFLFDEMDASSPAAVVAMNAALANGICPFPDAIISRHADFHCIGAGNTKLTGASRAYAGRNQLDAASIDRFAFIEFGYDDELESALATDAAWCKYVQRARKVVADRGLNHLITPRATYDGCKLLAKGFDRDTVASMVVFKGLDADTVRQIQNGMVGA